MLLLPMRVETRPTDTSFAQDILAFELRNERARRWRRRRRLWMLRTLLRGRVPWHVRVPAVGAAHARAVTLAQ